MHDMVIDRVFVERGVSGSKQLVERPEGIVSRGLV